MLSFLLRFVLCVFLSYKAWDIAELYGAGYGPIVLVVVAVAWGIFFAPFIVDLIPAVRYWARYSVLNRWQGRYYSFDHYHLRFYMVDDVIWLPIKDIQNLIVPRLAERELRLLGDDYKIIPGHKQIGVTEAGLLRLLATRTEHRRANIKMLRFKLWLTTSALPNVKRLPKSRANIL
ncbi:hypothetical protein QN372_05650 [Undibacterium sp. RTI2.1]|uniref:hypothetical protein n=1 Tax=unclassified Undibacterium TaxID=2630295 RepID=UPI002AB5B4BD|nr:MULTISPECIES: hypothetical protein [unclassified Undibacterium]MDY7538722.1 hypothetical protein [Undibacterium sp. 5I1]MEB0030222.1 hypothetical protein [Undibacterium sp. RTI2.1]MEB0116846.1 hypothetical protein [Undibacterium sp. RTI2.2]MEB0229661.1 hypothetical protein [Undibacterium sp. 10I3]MEB0259348.1 hypothetical protein [Undibacterium sp. 5I1]